MTCEKAAEVHAYHDGELGPARGSALEAHLDQCADCRQLLDELRGLSRLFAYAELPAMPDGVLGRVEGVFRQASERAVLRIASWLTGVAAALLIGALLMWSSLRLEPASRPAAVDTLVLAPATEPPGEPNSELIQVAQWMADDLSIGLSGGHQ
jgi:anti-sigma factor RsiW